MHQKYNFASIIKLIMIAVFMMVGLSLAIDCHAANARAMLSWGENPAPEQITQYVLYQSVDSGAFVPVRTLTPAELSVTVDLATPGHYSWYVTAVNVFGESAPSNTVTLDVIYPTSPTLNLQLLTD